MTNPIRIWICAAYNPVYRCGGWANVRLVQGQVSGTAGGERNTTARRMALAGLVSALRALPPATPNIASVSILSNSPDLAAFAAFLSRLGGAAPGGPPRLPGDAQSDADPDLDLWAQILTAAKGRQLGLSLAATQPETPVGFAAAWADLARDKAKASGAFTATIPNPNLAKAPGLGAARG